MGLETAALSALGLASTGATGVLYASPFIASLPSISTVVGALSAGMGLFSGISSMGEAEEQSAMAEASATLAGKESARQAVLLANKEKEKNDATVRKQKLAYLASGVTLEGSPLLVMENTRQKGIENVNEILESGASASTTAETEGRIKSKQLLASGRSSLLKGLTGSASWLSKMAA